MEGILVLLLVIAYFYFCWGVYRKVCRKTEKTWIRAVTVLLLIFLGFGDNIIGNAVFYYLVWKKGGERIYQKVENVPGFMLETDYYSEIRTFEKSLYSGRYDYIEVHLKKAPHIMKDGMPHWPNLVNEGYYRFVAANAGNEFCKDYENYYKELKATYRYAAESVNNPPVPGKCIAYEKIEMPQSRYSVEFDKGKDVSETWFHISLQSTTIRDMHTGKTVAERNSIYYAGGWVMHAIFEYKQAKSFPEDPHDHIGGINFVYKILNPAIK